MTEFAILCAVWLAFLVLIARKGMTHLLKPHIAFTLPVLGGLAAAILEALPTQPMSAGFTLRTIIAVLAGVFAGRLVGKVAKLWAMGHERRAAANPLLKAPRLVHPLIAVGMFIAGVPAIWHLISSNHAFLEEELTPRDATTGIAHGFEAIRLPADGESGALLVHGLYGSPADFGELPSRLHERGFAVFAPLLPGHGTKPDDLDLVWAEGYRKAVRAAYDDLAAMHPRVVLIGHSMGGTLAMLAAAERKPAAIVLSNPYVGRLVTPAWCPISYDALLTPMSRAVQRRIDAGDGLARIYHTQSLHAARQCRDLGRAIDGAAPKIDCPQLVLVSDRDEVVPTDATIEWTAAHLKPRVVRYPASSHSLYLGPDAAAAIDETLAFVVK